MIAPSSEHHLLDALRFAELVAMPLPSRVPTRPDDPYQRLRQATGRTRTLALLSHRSRWREALV